MAIILFEKGTGEAKKFNEFGFEHMLANGWCLTKKEALGSDEENISQDTDSLSALPVNRKVSEEVKPKKRGRKKKA